MAVVNLTTLLKGKTGWVSLSKDNKRIVAQAKNLETLISQLRKLGNPDGHITYLPPGKVANYVG